MSLAALLYAFFFLLPHWVFILLMAGAIMVYGLKWARIFLIRMIVDYDADNGNGRVIIERLLPHPTLPETVQFPLQQAAQGSPEVNTKGMFNTLVSQFRGLKFLHNFVVGDLTLRGPAAPFGITMYSIKDPAGVKAKIEADWKKIEGLKNRDKAEKERNEQIDRMTVAVSQGIVQGFSQIKDVLPKPEPPALPPAQPPAPDPMEWEPAWSLKTARAGGGGMQAKSTRPPAPEPEEESASAESAAPEQPVDSAQAPLGATQLASETAPSEPASPAPSQPASSSPPDAPVSPTSGNPTNT
ncbi:MAG TPA: hypothetical protein VI793_07350 [Anaerolineales bacterium]|nr:hypothetical protein [Anaerolineales bacterium]